MLSLTRGVLFVGSLRYGTYDLGHELADYKDHAEHSSQFPAAPIFINPEFEAPFMIGRHSASPLQTTSRTAILFSGRWRDPSWAAGKQVASFPLLVMGRCPVFWGI